MNRRRRSHGSSSRDYPRTARVNELLREIIGDELERIDDPRLEWISITGVQVNPELTSAAVYYSSLGGPESDPEVLAALAHAPIVARLGLGADEAMRTPLALSPGVEVTARHFDRLLDVSTLVRRSLEDPALALPVGEEPAQLVLRDRVHVPLLRELAAAHVAFTDVTGDADVRYRVIPYDATLFSRPLFFHVDFPERQGALMKFLRAMNPTWNISLFHYRNHGSDYGRVLAGIQVPAAERAELMLHLNELHYSFVEETNNPAYRIFLGR